MGKKRNHHKPPDHVSVGTAEGWAYRDEHTRQVSKALERWDVGAECPHGCLPADPPTCSCWDGGERLALWPGLTVREAEALRHDVERLTSLVVTLEESVAAMRRDLLALVLEVKARG